MGSNVTTVGNWGGVLLGKYGLFAAGHAGNRETTPLWNMQSNPASPGTIARLPTKNVQPANLSTAQAPHALVLNGNYAGQGISGAYDSGPLFFQECTGWTKWGVQVRTDIPGNTISGLSATIYGTWDIDTASGALTTYDANGLVSSSANSNWFALPSPSQQSGESTTANPITGTNTVFWNNWHLAAIRIQVTSLVSGSVLFVIMVGV